MLRSNELNRSLFKRDAHLFDECLFVFVVFCCYWAYSIEQHQMNVDQMESNEFRQFLNTIEGQTFDHMHTFLSHLAFIQIFSTNGNRN